ncbi:hypothetical protein F8S09_08630 [Deinococcus sp. SDU3-2]|uniref:Uncharacterized protein n=1 Tax=Deinococcus terrestris TaxID=2651870 RepID=A0A7X1NVZ9_9DEIO|nr:DUF6624 domain-containing protein [Deinococcus terrestris]MPY66755.1 hypothetical protein [Deinococcus terrestris]
MERPHCRPWLLSRLEADQALRSGPVDAAAWLAFDTESTRVLRAVVTREGWPGRSRVGEEGATAAFLLAQHSPDLAFQREVLARLHAQPPGEADPAHAAFLHDRICIREGRPQRYGTQVGPDGQPFPLEPGDVDARRAGVGLEPLAEYLTGFRR